MTSCEKLSKHGWRWGGHQKPAPRADRERTRFYRRRLARHQAQRVCVSGQPANQTTTHLHYWTGSIYPVNQAGCDPNDATWLIRKRLHAARLINRPPPRGPTDAGLQTTSCWKLQAASAEGPSRLSTGACRWDLNAAPPPLINKEGMEQKQGDGPGAGASLAEPVKQPGYHERHSGPAQGRTQQAGAA